MSGDVTGINLGSTRAAGLRFAISFVQPKSGGPYTIPATPAGWTVTNHQPPYVDFIGGAVPIANPAPGSVTTIWFYDDGTTVHEVSRNYTRQPPLAIRNLPATCSEGDLAVVKDWSGKLGTCVSGGSLYIQAVCNASNVWQCP